MPKQSATGKPYQTSVLKNGMRVLKVPLHETKAVTVLVLTKVGSRHESKPVNGISHFVEHLMFKGTKRRPSTLSISRLLDGVGAEYNAFTGKDHTGYYIKINSEHLHLALDVIADMLANSKFDAKEIDRERTVIIEEISMYEDNPLMYLEDIFEETMYAGSTLGQLIAGPRSVIRNVTRDTILKFYKTHYFPSNMMVVVSGRYNEETIDEQLAKLFTVPATKQKELTFKPFRYTGTKPRVRVMYKETEQAQIGIGYPAASYFDKSLPALSLLTSILGGNMSSRLFIQIRERRGLAYAIRCTPTVYEDTGNLYIQAGVAKERTEEAIKAILVELEKIRKQGITEAELKRAKEFIKGKLVLELEDSDHIGAWFGKQWLLTKKIETPAEKMAKIQRVTREEVNALARKIINPQKMNLAIIGPYKDAKRFENLVKK
ncbi:MAG: insulinase family protein [Candidatus Nomurabacteria bacterium]|nr:MAG: insulinase family protein [Candidatus Nomurabacteria bacterium]